MADSVAIERRGLYGLMAEFDDPDVILDAATKARDAGYKKMEAYTPFPVHGLHEAVGFRDNRVPWLIFICGLLGAAAGYGLQWWTSTVDYPMNVGGRPYHSWPSFIPITFETTVLFAALGAVIGMLALNGLPLPYHPVFNAPGFDRASQDRFFLCIEAADPKFEAKETERFLTSLNPIRVSAVEK
jgi:hypothetical protein